MKKPRVVFDTNILVSAKMFPGGPPEELLKLATTGGLDLGVSEAILRELEIVLTNKFHLNSAATAIYFHLLTESSETVVPKNKLEIIKEDNDDNRILECAVEFKADFIVSGDSHLLNLKRHGKIVIVSSTVMLAILGSENFDSSKIKEKKSKYLVVAR